LPDPFEKPAQRPPQHERAQHAPARKTTAPAPAATALRGTDANESPQPGATPSNQASNAAQASALRATALEQLNQGAVDQAVTNLQHAPELDPASVVIKRDLNRALRIQSAVQARR